MNSRHQHLELSWPAGPAEVPLEGRDVHVWAATLDHVSLQQEHAQGILDPEETNRAERFHFQRDRTRFINSRTFLRGILARYLHCEPGLLRFAYGEHGKPRLNGRHARNGLHFNLAHSSDLAIVAITRLGEIGVDVEQVRTLDGMDELVTRFFSPRESVAFYRLPSEEKAESFFKLWTRKEAWLKATGEGISRFLSQVEVSFLPDEPARLLRVPQAYSPAENWNLDNLRPAPGFAAAVAVHARRTWVRCWHWQHDAGGAL